MSAIAIAMPAIATMRQPFQMENAAYGPLKVSRNKRSALDETGYSSKIRPAEIKQKNTDKKEKQIRAQQVIVHNQQMHLHSKTDKPENQCKPYDDDDDDDDDESLSAND
jgi:hypothetical protein